MAMTVSVPAFTHYCPHENWAVSSEFGSPSPAHVGQRLKAWVMWLRLDVKNFLTITMALEETSLEP